MFLLVQNHHFRIPGEGHEALSIPACMPKIISSFHNGGMKAKAIGGRMGNTEALLLPGRNPFGWEEWGKEVLCSWLYQPGVEPPPHREEGKRKLSWFKGIDFHLLN